MEEMMTYQQIIDEVRRRMLQTTDNFVYIGWQLKQLISSGMMQQAGYASIEELGRAEFGISKDDTYRFMRINSRYSAGGNSKELDERYRGMGRSKLSEMLSLPESDLELVTDKTKREDIRELNRFNRQDPIPEPEEGPAAGGELPDIIKAFFAPGRKDGHTMLLDILNILEEKKGNMVLSLEERLQECINPQGNSTFRFGKYFVFLYGAEEGMKYKVFGSSENHLVSYLEFARMTHLMFVTANPQQEGIDAWENMYGKEKTEQEPAGKTEKAAERTDPENPMQKTKAAGALASHPEPEPKSDPIPKSKQASEPLTVELESSRKTRQEEDMEPAEPEIPETPERDETQEKAGEKAESDTSLENVEETREIIPIEQSYPQEIHKNSGLAPAQLDAAEPEEDMEDFAQEICAMRTEAEEYLKKIGKALEENCYSAAKTETKKLAETLARIVEELEKKPLPGQEQMDLEGL